jgi:hypothetical protein
LKIRNVIFPAIAILVLAVFILNQYNSSSLYRKTKDTDSVNKEKNVKPPSDVENRRENFNRRTSKLIITKHARCRMECRHIDETEIREILERGTINYSKSDPAGRPDPKYALEGRTHDDQDVRIIFAPSDEGMVVITVIDLKNEWNCNCK